MALVITRGGIEWCGAVPGGEPVPVGEPVHVRDVDEQASSTRGADAVQVHQRGPACGHEVLEVLLRGLDPLVDDFELAGQLDRQPTSGLSDDVSRPDGREQCAGLVGGQELLGPAGEELEQHTVQPVDGLGPGATELVASVDQHP